MGLQRIFAYCLVNCNNWLLSEVSVLDVAQGGGYVHNLFGGQIKQRAEKDRATQYFEPHSTKLRGVGKVLDGDERFYNNIFLDDDGLQSYDDCQEPVWMGGNVFLYRAKPSKREEKPLRLPDADNRYRIRREGTDIVLELTLDADWPQQRQFPLITTELLGKTQLVGQAYEHPDGTPLKINTDYYNNPRDLDNPFPGPVELSKSKNELLVWPVEN